MYPSCPDIFVTFETPETSLAEAIRMVADTGEKPLQTVIAVTGGLVTGIAGSYTVQAAVQLFS